MKSGICPYPGLRPFTEEESIFFKGRDLHIRQIVKLLEENKMAFITGASGDGKSSMVYAGVVPYIRAGFSKAKFNSWLIFDFKPQRNPLASLAESASKEMGLPYDNTLRELRRGFSSLVDIYANSGFYTEDTSPDAANRGKNLLIIADQFEEVFTMNENFHDGTPSNESYTAINLLLETVRLSIARQLPVYVIFTMRSDYISQCTVFKDLPAFIAYSQFFVPQLKRTEIRQVIEEPAVLAGGSVSSRLSEVIINNLNSGFDQLPVLQHALNLLWKTANNGEQQLDLIHLAKIAGIAKDVLSDDERAEFDRWYFTLPEYRRKYYENPDLNNVLNAHAGTLYESAYDHFMHHADWAEKTITPDESKLIIEAAFKTLTKIDDNRQVRNRATLSEITGIINRPNISNATVCGVLNIFRTEDNTLLRPFSVEGKLDTQYLSGDTVLDVTHEALIRNWQLLSQWDAEELENLKEFSDFSSQVQRWLDNGRRQEFLLASGNYAFFNELMQKCNPNPYWIMKHDSSQRPEKDKYRAAVNHYEHGLTFLRQSQDALIAEEKARRKKLMTAIIGLLIFVAGLLAFSYWAMSEKANAVIQTARAEQNAAEAQAQQQRAEQQRKAALDAQQDAQQQRDTAQIMYRRALDAKEESDRARQQAELSRLEALQMRNTAEEQRENAVRERENAEKERQNALHQMELTAQANDSASRLYNIAICNTLAMKAKNEYEDKTLNLRLAKTAYEMSMRDNSVKQNNAELFDAMLFAMEQNNILQPLPLTGSPVRNFTIDNAGRIVSIADDAVITCHKILSGGRTAETSRIDEFQSKTPIENAVFVTPSLVAYSTKDKTSYALGLTSRTRAKLPTQTDYIKTASPAPDRKAFAVAYVNGVVDIISAADINAAPIASRDFGTRLTDVYYAADGNVYVLRRDGGLMKWNTATGKVSEVLPSTPGQNAFKMAAIPDKDLLAVCYSGGNIQFVNTNTDRLADNILGGHSKLENMQYDPKTGILALSSADKRISLINTKDLKGKALAIEEHSLGNSKVKSLAFNGKGVLFALTEDNKLRFWDTDIATYANTLNAMRLKPLSQDEWDLILGREFSEK